MASYVASVAGAPGIKGPQLPNDPGAPVFANNGCSGCHILKAAGASGTTGPDLDQVIPGMSAAEVKKSIVDPERQDHQGLSPGRHAPELRAGDQPAGPQRAGQVPAQVRGQAGRHSRAPSSNGPRGRDQVAVPAAPVVRPASASRSTTTWVIGNGTSRRARSTTPRSSHLDLSGGWVEMITSSAAKIAQGVLERRVGLVVVSDLATRRQAGRLHRPQRILEALPGLRDGAIDVRGPVLERGAGQRGHDDQDLAVSPHAAVLDLLQQSSAAHRLVGHHEHAVGIVAAPRHLGLVRKRAPRAPPQHPDPQAHLDGQEHRPERGAGQERRARSRRRLRCRSPPPRGRRLALTAADCASQAPGSLVSIRT